MSKKLSFSCPMPSFDFETITLAHGSGGMATHQLLEKGIFSLFSNPRLDRQHDGAYLEPEGRIAFSTDSFVVSPIFFPGGNIGELAINGTMNDLAMCGALPKYISLGLIIEEGLPIADLWKILESIKQIADQWDVEVVTGDTKVVDRGKGDKLFINTSGIGQVQNAADIGIGHVKEGDRVIVSGNVATHGMAIMSVREGLEFQTSLKSDTSYVGELVLALLNTFGQDIRFLRDPTRGGVATTLNEITTGLPVSIELEEQTIPILPQAKSACELLGLDLLYVANEGMFIAVVAKEIADEVLSLLHTFPLGKDAACIGQVTTSHPGKVIVRSAIGGRRVVTMLPGEQLPRIC